MKRFAGVAFVILFVIFLIRTPKYWPSFSKDESRYKTDTFYYVIKEGELCQQK